MYSYVLYYNIENSGINAVSASLFMKGIIMQIVWKKENKAGLSWHQLFPWDQFWQSVIVINNKHFTTGMTNKSRIVDYDNIYIWVHVNLGTQFTVAIQWSNYHKYTLPLKLDTVLISGVHSWVLPPSSQHSGSCKVPVSPEYCPLPSGHMVWNGSLTPWVLTPFHRIQGQGIVPASPEYCPLLIGLRVRTWFLHPLSMAPSSYDSGLGMTPASSEYCPLLTGLRIWSWFLHPLNIAPFS